MARAEERLRVLRMIQDKQISAAEGAGLLAAMRGEAPNPRSPGRALQSRSVRVRVTDMATGKLRLSITIPIGLVDVGLKMGARFAPDLAGMDLQAVQAAVKQGMQGKIVDVENASENERVEIFVE